MYDWPRGPDGTPQEGLFETTASILFVGYFHSARPYENVLDATVTGRRPKAVIPAPTRLRLGSRLCAAGR